jgi:hypothetical protein
MKTTVTAGASVASPSSIDEALESGFLPDDPTYRKTGRFADDTNTGSHSAQPSEDQEEEEQELEEDQEDQEEETPATSGEKDGDTAAASQAAPTQKKEEEEAGTEHRPQKTADKAESRWAKLSRENKELREKLARRDSQAQPTAQARETTQVSPPAAESKSKAEPRPKIEDVDAKTGQPKYASYADYEIARDEWLQNESVRKFQETQAKADRDRQMAHAKQVVIQKWNDDVAKARTKHADFDAVALNNALPLKEGTVPDVFILESPQGADVLYYLGKNPGELERINGPSAKPITQAPRPPHQTPAREPWRRIRSRLPSTRTTQRLHARAKRARPGSLANRTGK